MLDGLSGGHDLASSLPPGLVLVLGVVFTVASAGSFILDRLAKPSSDEISSLLKIAGWILLSLGAVAIYYGISPLS